MSRAIDWRGRTASPPQQDKEFRTRIVNTGTLSMHVAEIGEGPPVLLVHGFPECWIAWKDTMRFLARAGYRAIAVDLPGYNLSDKPDAVSAYYLERIARHFEGLLDALELDQVRLVGHDWGGAVSWMFTMLYPHRVERLIPINMPHPVIFAAAWRKPEQKRRSAYFYFFAMRNVASTMFQVFNSAAHRGMLWWFSGRSIQDNKLQEYAKAGQQPGAMRGSMSYYTALLARDPDAPLQKARPVHMPVRVIWGDRDPAFSRRLADPGDWATDRAVTFVEGAGHFVHLERPDEVHGLMLKALQEKSPDNE